MAPLPGFESTSALQIMEYTNYQFNLSTLKQKISSKNGILFHLYILSTFTNLVWNEDKADKHNSAKL